MKYVIILIAMLGFACTSASKKSTTSSTSQPTTQTQSQGTSKDAAKPVKTSSKASKSEKKAAKEPSKAGEVSCTSGEDTRTIAINKTDQGCEVTYTKAGKTNSVASGSADMKHCDEASEKIQKNLEGAGFTCK